EGDAVFWSPARDESTSAPTETVASNTHKRKRRFESTGYLPLAAQYLTKHGRILPSDGLTANCVARVTLGKAEAALANRSHSRLAMAASHAARLALIRPRNRGIRSRATTSRTPRGDVGAIAPLVNQAQDVAAMPLR